MTTPESAKRELIDLLLDNSVEFDASSLEQMPSEDLIVLIQTLRGHCLQLAGLVHELREQIEIVDAFARPKTRRFFYAPTRERIIQ